MLPVKETKFYHDGKAIEITVVGQFENLSQ
jgi:hypothetical protein